MDNTELPQKTMTGREPIYPLFKSYLPFAEGDDFWLSFLSECSTGILPRGVTITGNVITIKKATKLRNYELSDDPCSGFKQLKSLFQKELGITQKTEWPFPPPEPPVKRWKQVKRKQIRNGMLAQFIRRQKETLELSELHIQQLEYFIAVADALDLLTDESVVITKGEIESITCIEWTDKEYQLFLPEREYEFKYERPSHPIYRSYRDPPLDLEKAYKNRNESIVKKAEASKVRQIDIEE